MLKLYIAIERRSWGALPYPPYEGESLWVEALGDDLYRIDNTPVYVLDLSFGDVVRASRDALTSQLIFQGVEKRSGHPTFRVIPNENMERSADQLIQLLKSAWGCRTEVDPRGITALDVPSVDRDSANAIRGIIEGGVDEGVWSREIGCDSMPR